MEADAIMEEQCEEVSRGELYPPRPRSMQTVESDADGRVPDMMDLGRVDVVWYDL